MKPTSYVRIITHVPIKDLERVQKALGDAGAGIMGDYSHCSFIMKGTGYFTPMNGANPSIGTIGIPEQVEEYHLEFTCEKDILQEIMKALKEVHPYEEVPIFIHECFEV